MKLIDDLRKQLEAVGATLDEGGGYVLNCDAPSGYIWRANGCCALAIQCSNNSQSWFSAAIKEAMKDLRMGLEKVTDPDTIAEKRNDMDDDSWGAATEAPARIDWPKN